MAGTDLATDRHDADHEMDHYARMRILFVVWAAAMRILAWRHAMSTSRSGGAA